MKFEKSEPDKLDIRMTKLNDALTAYLDDGPLSDAEQPMLFEIFYGKVAGIFDGELEELAIGNLKAQHASATINHRIRKALESCKPFFEDDYMRGVIAKALSAKPINDPLAFRIVFDGPPGSEAGRFVEVEDLQGVGIKKGRWVQDVDYWYLVFDGKEE